MPYPAAFWQVIAWADYNGVDSQLREIMRKPARQDYLSLRDVAVSLERCNSRQQRQRLSRAPSSPRVEPNRCDCTLTGGGRGSAGA